MFLCVPPPATQMAFCVSNLAAGVHGLRLSSVGLLHTAFKLLAAPDPRTRALAAVALASAPPSLPLLPAAAATLGTGTY